MIAERPMYSPLVNLERLRSTHSLTHIHYWLWRDDCLILAKAIICVFVSSCFKQLIHLAPIRKLVLKSNSISLFIFLSTAPLFLLLQGCSLSDKNTMNDIDAQHLHTLAADVKQSVPIPNIRNNVPYVPPPTLLPVETLYSLSVLQAPIREVLHKLARDAELELSILDDLSAKVTINLIDQPLSAIVSRLNEQADISAVLQGKRLIVRLDRPYWVNYPIDYVNLDRFSASSMLLANAVGSASHTTPSVQLGATNAQQTAPTSLQSGSNVAILNRTQNEVWKTLGNGVMRILRSHYPMLGQPLSEGQAASSSKIVTAQKSLAASPSSTLTDLAEKAQHLPNQLPFPEQSLAIGSSVVSPYPEGESVSNYVNLAREAGFIGVYTTRKTHLEVQKYIDQLMMGSRRQVMIEATIVEVYLNDENQSGINWSAFTGGFMMKQSLVSDLAQRSGVTMISDGKVAQDWNINSTINLLQRFGRSQVLSSPKMVGINNQPTLLKVVRNLVYFTTSVTPATTSNGVTSPAVFSTTPNTVPVGLVMSVLPSIDQHDQITLVVRPTISNLVGYVEDPNPEFKRVNVVSKIPEIQEREMESVLKLNDGQIAILGGLIQDEAISDDSGVPGLVDEPVLGYLFGQKTRQKRKTELVIFIRPTLIKHPDIETGDFVAQRSLLERYTRPQLTQSE